MPKNREGAKKISISRHSRCFLIRIQFIFTHIFHYTARKMIDSMGNPTQHRAYFGTNKKAKIIFLFFCCSFAHTWEKHIFPCRQQTHNMCGRTEWVEAALIFHIYENFPFDTSFCRFALWANFRKGFYVLRFVFEMGEDGELSCFWISDGFLIEKSNFAGPKSFRMEEKN